MCVQKKIAYILLSYDAHHSGVYNKILDQISFWRSSGYIVQLFVITDLGSVEKWKSIDEQAVVLTDSNFLKKLCNRINVAKLAIATRPTMIYLRDSFPIRIPKSKIPVIVEIQSLMGQELRNRSWIRYFLFTILKKPTYANISGAVFVTQELLKINELQLSNHIPKIEIGNSINLERITPLPSRRDEQQGLFFVGSPNQPWHGVLELIDFARDNPEINVHIVGQIGEKTVSNLYFYGKLDADGYRTVADKCIAGVGSLNLKLNKMNQASSLKVREYLALGLPVILKYQDSDLDGADPFVLQLPNDGRSLTDFSAEIKAFLDRWATKRVPRSEIFKVDVQTKEVIRLEFMEEVLLKVATDKMPGG
jgi:hypothetical protein